MNHLTNMYNIKSVNGFFRISMYFFMYKQNGEHFKKEELFYQF